MREHDVIHKTGSTKRIALPSEEDRAMATGDMYSKNFGEIATCGCEIRELISKQTDRQTNTVIAIRRTPTGGGWEVTNYRYCVDNSGLLA